MVGLGQVINTSNFLLILAHLGKVYNQPIGQGCLLQTVIVEGDRLPLRHGNENKKPP